MRTVVVSGVFCGIMLGLLGWSPVGHADGKGKKECKPRAPAAELELGGAVALTQAIDYQGQRWVLVADKVSKPDKLRLVSAQDEVIELGKPPSTVEPTHFMGRGQAFYAVGTARSQTPGKRDVIVLRWGTDPRPRLTTLWTVDVVDGKPRAAIRDEHMVVLFSEPGPDGKSHVMSGAIQLEEMRIEPVVDLGERTPDGFFDVVALPQGFSAGFEGGQGFMRASFDNHGKTKASASALLWSAPSAVRALWLCGEHTWMLHDAGKELALAKYEADGAVVEVAKLPSSKAEALPALCTEDGVALGYLRANAKDNTVMLSVATVDGRGKVRERPVRDIKGTLDDVREPQLLGTTEHPSAFWVEGKAAGTSAWLRQLTCE